MRCKATADVFTTQSLHPRLEDHGAKGVGKTTGAEDQEARCKTESSDYDGESMHLRSKQELISG